MMQKTKDIIKRYKPLIIGVAVLVTVIVVMLLVSIVFVLPAIRVTKEYNNIAKEYNSLIPEYNEKACKVAVYNIEGMPSELNEISIVSESYFDVLGSLISGNSKEKIINDIGTIKELIKGVHIFDEILGKIYAPKAEEVCTAVKTIEQVTDAACVSEDNDPDGILGSDGGYIGCVYFALDNVDQSIVPGDNVIDKGTDAGGAVEIYKSKEDAENRCEYLSQFDETILYTGSYAVIGTVVVRTSYLLDFDDQVKMTGEITNALTALEASNDEAADGTYTTTEDDSEPEVGELDVTVVEDTIMEEQQAVIGEEVKNYKITLNLSYGERSGTYTGTLVEGLPSGQGSFSTKNAKGHVWTYVGEWVDGHMNGEGVCTWPNQVFEGTYVDDYEFYGTYTFTKDDEKYVGQCEKGNIQGEGVYYFSDGSTFTGTFDGRYDAVGIYESEGKKQDASLVNGKVVIKK